MIRRAEARPEACHLVAFAPPASAIAQLAAGPVIALTHRASFDLRALAVPHRPHTELSGAADWPSTNDEIHRRLLSAAAWPTAEGGRALPPLLDLFSSFLVSEVSHDYYLARIVRTAVEVERPRRCVLWVRSDSFENPRRFEVVERVLRQLGIPFEGGAP